MRYGVRRKGHRKDQTKRMGKYAGRGWVLARRNGQAGDTSGGVGGATRRRRGRVEGSSQHDAVVAFLAALSSAEEGRPGGILEDLANTLA